MFSIKQIRIITENIQDEKWQEVREFLSPDGKFKLILYNPFEFAMGGYEWQIRLMYNNIDITKDHPILSQDKKMCPYIYQPWSYDSKKILLVNKKGKEQFYDILNKEIHDCDFNGFSVSILGSKYLPKYLLTTHEEVFLMDLNGQILEKVNFKTPPYEYPVAHWLKSNSHFFVIGRDSKDASPQMVFFDANTHQKTQSIKLDPNEIVPYEDEKYRSINRDGFALVQLPGSSWTVGRFLDVWYGINFDEERNTLLLKICRPISDVYREGFFSKNYECRVKNIMVQVEISII